MARRRGGSHRNEILPHVVHFLLFDKAVTGHASSARKGSLGSQPAQASDLWKCTLRQTPSVATQSLDSSKALECGTRVPCRVLAIVWMMRTYATSATVGLSSLTVGCEIVEAIAVPRSSAVPS